MKQIKYISILKNNFKNNAAKLGIINYYFQ